MKVGTRPLGRVLRAPLQAGHWRALPGMARAYPPADVPGNFARYLSGRGEYPRDVRVRTPVGTVQAQLDAHDDLLTINEVFARGDYAAPEDLRVAVDVGANIGLASLYFLTRNAQARVHCIEPDPKNVVRLRRNLEPWAGRFTLHEVAAAESDGEATFWVEPTGRYGGFERGWQEESITVPTRSFLGLIDEVLAKEERIDLLKVDVEGPEVELISSLRPDQLDRIDRIYYETNGPEPLHPDRYDHRFGEQTNALVRRTS